MASVTARRVGRGRKHKDRDWGGSAPAPIYIPDPVTIPQKNESLDRRIRNIEALGNGVFLGNVLASYLALPGLVGFWPMSSVQRSTGNAYDLSGQGRTLTYVGNPAYTYFNGLVPYIDLDGTGDYLARADETDLDIQGNESVFTTGAAGLTMGGWYWLDTTAGTQPLISKDGVSAQRSYNLIFGSGVVQFAAFGAGSNSVSSTEVISAATWYFMAGRFTPSIEVAVFVNNTKTIDTTSINATLTAGTQSLGIGTDDTTRLLDGRASLVFLCANALGDDLISSLFSSSRILFGV